MAQRFKATDLKEMIRTIVRQEIKEVVAQTINEVLSERYLRQLAENVAARPRGVADLEQMGDPAIDEPPPHPLANSREWPFDKHPMKHDDYVSPENGEDQERDKEDPMSIFFEGTRSLKEIEENAPTESELGPRGKVIRITEGERLDEQKKVWTTLAGVSAKKEDKTDLAAKAQFEEARIKRMREELDRKV